MLADWALNILYLASGCSFITAIIQLSDLTVWEGIIFLTAGIYFIVYAINSFVRRSWSKPW